MKRKPRARQKWLLGVLSGQLGYKSAATAMQQELSYPGMPETSGVADAAIGELQRKLQEREQYAQLRECINKTGFPPHLWGGPEALQDFWEEQ